MNQTEEKHEVSYIRPLSSLSKAIYDGKTPGFGIYVTSYVFLDKAQLNELIDFAREIFPDLEVFNQ